MAPWHPSEDANPHILLLLCLCTASELLRIICCFVTNYCFVNIVALTVLLLPLSCCEYECNPIGGRLAAEDTSFLKERCPHTIKGMIALRVPLESGHEPAGNVR